MKTDVLEEDVEKISLHLKMKQYQFDQVMQLSREVIREAGQTITLLHNSDSKSAAEHIASMKKVLKELSKIDDGFRYHSLQTYQEYAEAFAFFKIKTEGRLPQISETGVDNEAYLLGLMDVVGELKREVLEALRESDLKSAESYFEMMKLIYDKTRHLRFAEAVLSGFRKKQDVARIQLENAGGEILSYRLSKKR